MKAFQLSRKHSYYLGFLQIKYLELHKKFQSHSKHFVRLERYIVQDLLHPKKQVACVLSDFLYSLGNSAAMLSFAAVSSGRICSQVHKCYLSEFPTEVCLDV